RTMNKPFITQAQLALYKYQPSSKYFGQSMAFIAQKEFEEFVNNLKEYDILESFSYFLNKRVAHNIWKIYFSDESVIFIRKSEENGKTVHEFVYQEYTDSSDFNSMFE
ncbi:DUF1132 family protein, partial [Streptomyces sp. DSM 41493]